MYNPSAQLALLEQQLNSLKNSYNLNNVSQPSTTVTTTSSYNPTYEQQIQNIVQQEIAKYIPNVKPVEPQKPLTEYEKLMKDINDLATVVLSEDHQKFLMDQEILRCVPVFLKSSKGKEAMALLVNEFKSYIDR